MEFQCSVFYCCILIFFLISLTTFIYPALPTCLSHFLDHTIQSSSCHPLISIIQYPLSDLFIFPDPHILLWHDTSSRLHQPASAVCFFSPYRVPGSSKIYRLRLPSLSDRSILLVPPYLICTRLYPSQCYFPSPFIYRCLVSTWVGFFVCKGKGPWCLHTLLVARPIPWPNPLLSHAGTGVRA